MKQKHFVYSQLCIANTNLKTKPFQLLLALGIIITGFFISCEDLIRKTGIATGEAIEVGYQSAKVSGTITDLSEQPHMQHGFCYAKQPNPTLDDAIVDLGSGAGVGNYTAELTGLDKEIFMVDIIGSTYVAWIGDDIFNLNTFLCFDPLTGKIAGKMKDTAYPYFTESGDAFVKFDGNKGMFRFKTN